MAWDAPDSWDYMKKMSGTDRGAISDYHGQALGYINREPKRDPVTGKAREGAELGLWQGVAQQQGAMQAAANRRGYNPAMARSASYAGGELESRAHGLADQMRAMQEQHRRQLMMGALQKRSDAELAQMGIDETMFGEKLAGDYHMDQVADAVTKESEAAHAEGYKQYAMAMATLAMAMSDKNAKQNAYQAGRRDQDALIRELAPDAAAEMRQKYGSSLGPDSDEAYRARALAEGLRQHDARTLGQLRDAGTVLGPQQVDQSIRVIRPHTFEYKPEYQAAGQPLGRQYGVMAQDLEKAPLGRGMVVNTPQGKMIDTRQATGALLGMVGRLGERIDDLERGKR